MTALFSYESAIIALVSAVVSAGVATLLNWWRENYHRRWQAKREDSLLERHSQEWISQRWWERKASAYSEIIEALWQTMEYAREYLDHMSGESRQAVNDQSEKYTNYDRNRAQLVRLADVGAFVISDEVAEALQQYIRTVRAIPDWTDPYDEVNASYGAAKQCLEEVKAAALRDLRLTREIPVNFHTGKTKR